MSERQYTDAELDAIDPMAPDPKFRRNRHRPAVFQQVVVQDHAVLVHATQQEDQWMQAAAFGVASVSCNDECVVTYLDMIMTLGSMPPKRDRRRKVDRDD